MGMLQVRFPKVRHEGPRKSWVYGKLLNVKDGNATVVDATTGGLRTRPTSELEVQEKGPRGGNKWVPFGA